MKGNAIIGIDVGGTKIRAGLVAPHGKVVKRVTIPTEAGKGSKTVLRNIVSVAERVWRNDVRGIGIGLAGIVDRKKGVFLQGQNLPRSFRNVPIGRLLEKRFKVPITVDNDVHCFTLAEATLGAGKRFSHVVGLMFGTGIGGGIVVDGRLFRGRDNAAGEFGHTVIDAGSPYACGCGRKGHFEAMASGTGMSNIYRRLTGKKIEPYEV